MMSEQRVTWGDDGWAATDGWASAHCADPQTGVYTGIHDVWVSNGGGLPAGAYLDAPEGAELGKAIFRRNNAWIMLDDHRGQTAYNKKNLQPVVINELGELPAELTLLPPQSDFDSWDEADNAWMKDDAAERESITRTLTASVQAHMDDQAHALNYDDIKTAVTYADEPAVPKFQAEGLVFREWRSLCWAHCYAAMAAVHLGERAIPTAEELIAELPPLVFPA